MKKKRMNGHLCEKSTKTFFLPILSGEQLIFCPDQSKSIKKKSSSWWDTNKGVHTRHIKVVSQMVISCSHFFFFLKMYFDVYKDLSSFIFFLSQSGLK